MAEEVIEEDETWVRGIKIQTKLITAMEKRFKQLGMIPLNRTDSIRYCINAWLQFTAKDIAIFD